MAKLTAKENETLLKLLAKLGVVLPTADESDEEEEDDEDADDEDSDDEDSDDEDSDEEESDDEDEDDEDEDDEDEDEDEDEEETDPLEEAREQLKRIIGNKKLGKAAATKLLKAHKAAKLSHLKGAAIKKFIAAAKKLK